jgi:hypothetical protein
MLNQLFEEHMSFVSETLSHDTQANHFRRLTFSQDYSWRVPKPLFKGSFSPLSTNHAHI